MKRILTSIIIITVLCAGLSLLLVGMNEQAKPAVKCYNGTFVGKTENNISSFKGIPYAKAPIGELRWKAPQPVEADDATYDATRFGKSALQLKSDSEQASMNPEGLSEDCLTLNIWTADLEKKNKPVMFWIHGGAYSYGGTADPLYDGSFIVAENPDVLVVTCNYRVGPMGFIDFSGIKGGENYPTSGYNGLLDQIQGLKWVQQNIEAFGGDPDNVTIFGESAGGGSVTELLIAEGTEGLFHHAIAQSGSVNFTMTHQRFKEIGAAEKLMEKAHAQSVDELAALSEEALSKIYTDDSDGKAIASYSVLPLRGDDSILPSDPYQAILDGAGKDIDLIIGTTADENRYFIDAVGEPGLASVSGKEQEALKQEKFEIYEKAVVGERLDTKIDSCSPEEKANIGRFMDKYSNLENIWQLTELLNEIGFRSPAIKVAENHALAGGKGKTYMYYFCKKNTNFDWIGACHASELSYVFHNTKDEQFSGKVIPDLADTMCGQWTHFAMTGTPTEDAAEWPEYSVKNRETMIYNDDATAVVVNDPKKEDRELIDCILHHYFSL